MRMPKAPNRWTKRLLYLILVLIFLAAGYRIYLYIQDSFGYEKLFEELEQIEEREKDPAPRLPSGEEQNTKPPENPDWIGWLSIKDTGISYPVMQRIGDAEYYLHRDFNGEYSFYGTPFLDARCTPESDNCIIYGHNINGRRMFGQLHAYADESYYEEHPQIRLRFGGSTRDFQIVSAIRTNIYSPVYSFTDAGNWEEYRNYVKNLISQSLYHTEAGDEISGELENDTSEQFFRRYQFITLSTCRSWAGKNARFMVIAAAERVKRLQAQAFSLHYGLEK